MILFIIGRLSSDGSVASIATTPQENLSNESENLAGIYCYDNIMRCTV